MTHASQRAPAEPPQHRQTYFFSSILSSTVCLAWSPFACTWSLPYLVGQRGGSEHPALSCLSEQPLLPPHHPQLYHGVRVNLLCSVLLPSFCHNLPVTGREAASTGHLTGRAPAFQEVLSSLPCPKTLTLMELGEATKPPKHCSRRCWGFPGHPQLCFGAQGSLTCSAAGPALAWWWRRPGRCTGRW